MSDSHFIPSDELRLERLDGVFSLEDWISHHAIRIDRGPPLTVITPAEQWSYAISFPRQARGSADLGRVLIRIEGWVASGVVGVGAIRADGSRFLAEVSRSPRHGRTSFDLVLDSIGDCHAIIVRNHAEGGRPSKVVLESLHVYQVLGGQGPDEGESGRPARQGAYAGGQRGFHGKDCFEDQADILQGKADIVFDVGANHGDTVQQYLKLFGRARIHGFEPFPDAFEDFRRRFADQPRVIPHQTALADRVGRVDFHSFDNDATNSLFPFARDADRFVEGAMGTKEVLSVACTTVDDFCRGEGIDRIDVLKLDVQGAELRVLRGAERVLSRRRIGLVFLEVNFVPVYEGQAEFHEIARFLQLRGYRVFDFYNYTYAHTGQVKWGDAIFLPA